jgi:hypothetical protein
MRKMLFGLLFLSGLVLSLSAADGVSGRAVDLAAEQAGETLCNELDAADIPEDIRIAFLPLFCGDGSNASIQVYSVIRAELAGRKTKFSMYTRDESVWDKLVGEIDFGARRQDVMDAATIQKFAAIKGLDALLYGEVRETSADSDGGGVTRVALFLSDVETGRLLWSDNIMGKYNPPAEPEIPHSEVLLNRLIDKAVDNIVLIVAGLVGLIAIGMFLKSVTRPR